MEQPSEQGGQKKNFYFYCSERSADLAVYNEIRKFLKNFPITEIRQVCTFLPQMAIPISNIDVPCK